MVFVFGNRRRSPRSKERPAATERSRHGPTRRGLDAINRTLNLPPLCLCTPSMIFKIKFDGALVFLVPNAHDVSGRS